MEKKYEMMALMAKTGLFFANCDGNYDPKEQKFISIYIQTLSDNEHIPDEISSLLQDTIKHTFTLEMILSDTRTLLTGFNPDECREIIRVIKDFISQLIAVDGHIDSNKQRYFNEWLQSFNEYCD